jgi:hypothetical protein
MINLTDEEKNKVVSSILTNVDNVNVVIQTPNYVRKYSEINYELEIPDENSIKTYLITNRERFRKILLVDWLNDYFTTSQVEDITNTLSLIRQKISELFTN